MDNQQQELFGVNVNQEGISAIKKIVHLVNWILGLCILISIFSTISAFVRYSKYKLSLVKAPGIVATIEEFYPYYIMATAILYLVQISYLVKFSRKSYFSVTNKDEVLFNKSFNSLYYYLVFGIVGSLLDMAMGTLQLYIISAYY